MTTSSRPIGLDGDGFLDLVTINDGTPSPNGLRERIFRNDGTGSFQDVMEEWWPDWGSGVATTLDAERARALWQNAGELSALVERDRAPVAQWIRAADFGSAGRGFESLRARHTT
jgi:hypothetical protein